MTSADFKREQMISLDDHCILVLHPAILLDKFQIIKNINSIGSENIYLATNSYVPTPLWEAALNGEDVGKLPSLLAVAEVNGKVIGHGRSFSVGLDTKDAHVVDFGIALLREYRLKTIGSQLLKYLIDWSQQVGYKKITANVFASNEVALHVFDKLGFHIEGIRKEQYKIYNKPTDEILLAKFI
jgi:RimJ/RimL family protein N-acetyltransferase